MLRENAPDRTDQMPPPRLPCLMFGLVFVAGCAGLPAPEPMRRIDVAAVRPAGAGVGAARTDCWASDETPAVIETITEAPATGAATAPQSGATRHRIVTPRRELWFRVPCPGTITPDLVAALQRALAVRGHYPGPVTGRMDTATRRALRAYQQPRGLDSAVLSLDAARQMGLVAYAPGEE